MTIEQKGFEPTELEPTELERQSKINIIIERLSNLPAGTQLGSVESAGTKIDLNSLISLDKQTEQKNTIDLLMKNNSLFQLADYASYMIEREFSKYQVGKSVIERAMKYPVNAGPEKELVDMELPGEQMSAEEEKKITRNIVDYLSRYSDAYKYPGSFFGIGSLTKRSGSDMGKLGTGGKAFKDADTEYIANCIFLTDRNNYFGAVENDKYVSTLISKPVDLRKINLHFIVHTKNGEIITQLLT